MPIDAERWQRLSPWLDRLLEQPTGEREPWLDALARREPALAAELRAVMASRAASAGARLLEDGAKAPGPHALAGRRIGAYTLREPLGEGGMGTVWLAERSDGRFEGRAAVKLLHAGLVHHAVAERFRREGAILARLSHPNIARLVDAGLTDDAQPYLVLEHVAGERIDRWCDERRLDLRARLALFAQVLQAVQHAHVQLVVHRDLKPANVMVDARGAVKLLDFGIAKLLDADPAQAQSAEPTRDGGRALTPLFAAPEQISGADVSTAMDVYALGLLLYLLLTGQHPRVNAHGRTAAAEATLPPASQAVTDLARRSEDELHQAAAARGTTPRRLAQALAGDLDNVLVKALRLDPAERYATVAAFADDLRRHLEGRPVKARPTSLAYRASRFVGRNRLGVALGGVGVAVVLGAAVVADHQRREAERERDLATRQQAAADAVAIFMEELLGQVGEAGGSKSAAELLDFGQRRAVQLFFDAPEVMARLHRRFWVLNSMLGRTSERERNSEAVARAAAGIADPIERTDALCSATADLRDKSAAIDRIDRLLAGLPDSERSRGVRWNCLFQKGEHLFAAARFAEADRAYEQARLSAPPLLRRLKEIQHVRARGAIYDGQGRASEAERVYAEAGRLYEAAGRGRSLAMAWNLTIRAFHTSDMGRPREAIALAEQAAEIAQSTGAAAGAELLTMIEVRMAMEQVKLDRRQEARGRLEAALRRDGRLQPRTPRGWNAVALAHVLRGEHAQAVAVLERDLAEHAGMGDGLMDRVNRIALGQVWLEKGDAARALTALEGTGEGLGSEPFRWDSFWLRARALNVAGRAPEAEAAARVAVVEASRRAPSGRSAVHGHAFLELARALAAQGRQDEAREAAARASAELSDSLGERHGAAKAARDLSRP